MAVPAPSSTVRHSAHQGLLLYLFRGGHMTLPPRRRCVFLAMRPHHAGKKS